MASLELAESPQFLASLSRLRARVSLAELLGPDRAPEVSSINWQVDPWAIGKSTIALHRNVREAAQTADSVDEQTRREHLWMLEGGRL